MVHQVNKVYQVILQNKLQEAEKEKLVHQVYQADQVEQEIVVYKVYPVTRVRLANVVILLSVLKVEEEKEVNKAYQV